MFFTQGAAISDLLFHDELNVVASNATRIVVDVIALYTSVTAYVPYAAICRSRHHDSSKSSIFQKSYTVCPTWILARMSCRSTTTADVTTHFYYGFRAYKSQDHWKY